MTQKEIDRLRFAHLLSRHRLKAKMTQAQLAKKSGLQTSLISHYERQRRTPCITNLKALSEALNIRVDELLYGVL